MSLKIQQRLVVESTDWSALEKIKGTVPTKYKWHSVPFQGWIFRIKREHAKISLYYSEVPKKPTQIAAETKASAVLNAGFWNKKKLPLDWCIFHQKEITPLTNTARPAIYFSENDVKIDWILSNPEKKNLIPISTDQIQNVKIQTDILQAGPMLHYHGEPWRDYTDYKIRAAEFDSDITLHRHPRTIFGYDATEYYFIVINGRSQTSAGLFLEECANLVHELGLIDAINLDGGASSTLIVENRLINQPRFCWFRKNRFCSAPIPGKERTIPDALIVHHKT